MNADIVERLRVVGGRTYKDRIRRNEERNEAADEIERLRALITAWADATDNDERDGWVSSEVIQAEAALRKAVGR